MNENIASLFNAVIGVFGIGAGAYFWRSKVKKKADDGSSIASTVKEWTEAFKLVTEPLNKRIETLETNHREQQAEILELSIQVGVLLRENDRKDARIKELEAEKKVLIERIKYLEEVA